MSPTWLRIVSLCGVLFAVVGLPCWPLTASDSMEDEVDLTLSEGGESFTNSVGMKFVRIKRGKFTIGAPNNDNEASPSERPQHEVTITKDFYLGVYEVTQKQYKAVMGTNPSHFSSDGQGKNAVMGMSTDDFPVENISWNDTQAFFEKLVTLPGERGRKGRYRLPTEAEWEYACRAGVDKRFHFGDEITAKQANFTGAPNRPVKVGSYKPNTWGLYDMHGNVWEWCRDWYSPNAYADKKRIDPTGPATGSTRVIRGGGWSSGARYCRSSQRGTNQLTYRGNFNGFRVACSVGPN